MILAETLRQSAGKHMTELTGFFAFSKYADMPDHKSAHEPVPTEWETVWLISPYNCYQNTVASDCFNQSLHSQAPRQPLTAASRCEAGPAGEKGLPLHPDGRLRLGHAALRVSAQPLAQRGSRQDPAGVGHQSESAGNLSGPDCLLLQHRRRRPTPSPPMPVPPVT